jgi:hypothetical protein
VRYPNRMIAIVLCGLLAATAMTTSTYADTHPPVPRQVTSPSATATPGEAGPALVIPTKRSETLARAHTWLTAWHGGPVPYSQSRYLNGWRTNCSGYVSMAWNLQNASGRPLNYNTDSTDPARFRAGFLLLDLRDRQHRRSCPDTPMTSSSPTSAVRRR